MEYISSSALFCVIDNFLENLTRLRTCYGVDMVFLLQKFTFWFVPCLNPDGVDLAISDAFPSPLYERQVRMNGGLDFSEWQSNARGVDLNHNYDFRFWEYKKIEEEKRILPGKTRFSGEYPESEPETSALLRLVRIIKPELILSFHSQGEEVFYRPRKSKKAKKTAKSASEILGYTLSVPEGLAEFGGLSDYAGEVLGIPSLTVELGRGKNPLPKAQLPVISEKLTRLHAVLPTLL
jgi:g-D-glutamyl-meso-diaminopimelate peptidase